MRRFRWVLGVLVLGLASALVGAVPDKVSAATGRARCRPTAFVTNSGSNTVSTIDVKTGAKDPTDMAVGTYPQGVAITPDGKTVFVANSLGGTVSTIDVKTRTKNPADIAVGTRPVDVAVTPNGKTAFVTNSLAGTVAAVDVKTRTNDAADVLVGSIPSRVAVTPDGRRSSSPTTAAAPCRRLMRRPGRSTPPTSPWASIPRT
jgi:YVTN family beta-propeller protein